MIYTIRTTSGREDIVVDLLMSKIQADNVDVKSVFHPAEIKGYIFVEGSIGSVHKAAQGLMHSRGIIDKPINMSEIQHFLEYKKTRLKVDIGDIMEIIGGPFKGEKGRIIRINKIKDEITAELLEASIPIPVTIATEFVKIIKKTKTIEEDKSVFDKEELDKVNRSETAEAASEAPAEESKEGPKEEKPAADEKPLEGTKPEEKKKRKSFLEELENI